MTVDVVLSRDCIYDRVLDVTVLSRVRVTVSVAPLRRCKRRAHSCVRACARVKAPLVIMTAPDRAIDVIVLSRVDVTVAMAPLRRRDCHVSRAPLAGHIRVLGRRHPGALPSPHSRTPFLASIALIS
jgi:hypothetical protein